jgi:hypothetical protein
MGMAMAQDRNRDHQRNVAEGKDRGGGATSGLN